MKLKEVEIRIISDSRGQETLEAEMESDSGKKSQASIPSGKSRSAYEAFVLEPAKAKNIFEKEVKEKILEHNFSYQDKFDEFLIKLDGTSDKRRLGGNLILVLSLAWARLKAKEEKIELFRYINKIYRGGANIVHPTLPRMIFNMINGGAHGKNNLEFQEFQVIPQHATILEGLKEARKFYRALEKELDSKFGKDEIELGDEAGFSVDLKGNEQALKILKEVSRKVSFLDKFSFDLSLDVAANSFYKDGKYEVNGEKWDVKELVDYYEHLIGKYGIMVMEDPFFEDAFHDFSELNKRKGIYIVADDLTSTNPHRISMAINNNSADAVIIKPNQIGSLTETIEASKLAHKAGWQLIVSHRSGETEDDFIADLAVGLNAWGIKAGAPETKYRLNKYFRLAEIEKKLNK